VNAIYFQYPHRKTDRHRRNSRHGLKSAASKTRGTRMPKTPSKSSLSKKNSRDSRHARASPRPGSVAEELYPTLRKLLFGGEIRLMKADR